MGRLGSVLSQSQGTEDRPGQWTLGVWQHHSHTLKPDTALQLPTSRLQVTAARGSRKLRLLGVDPSLAGLNSFTNTHDLFGNVLGNIRGHAKVFEVISIGDFLMWCDIRGVGIQVRDARTETNGSRFQGVRCRRNI